MSRFCRLALGAVMVAAATAALVWPLFEKWLTNGDGLAPITDMRTGGRDGAIEFVPLGE